MSVTRHLLVNANCYCICMSAKCLFTYRCALVDVPVLTEAQENRVDGQLVDAEEHAGDYEREDQHEDDGDHD